MHDTPGICAHCGYSLKNDEVLERGDWALDPRGATYFQGKLVKLPGKLHELLYSIAAMAPRVAPEHVLIERLDVSENTLKVHACRVRRELRAIGLPSPFETVWGAGFRWVDAEMVAAA